MEISRLLTQEELDSGDWDSLMNRLVPPAETAEFYNKCIELIFTYMDFTIHNIGDYDQMAADLQLAAQKLAHVTCLRAIAYAKDMWNDTLNDIFEIETSLSGNTKEQLQEQISKVDSFETLAEVDDLFEEYFKQIEERPRRVKPSSPSKKRLKPATLGNR